MARATARAPRRPLATLVRGLVVLAGMWLAGGLAAAAGWPSWTRWLAAALVCPIVPVTLLILISPRLGLGRVALVLTLLGAAVCTVWWRAGLVLAVTTHATWMLPAPDLVEPTPPETPAHAPGRPAEPVKPAPPTPPQPVDRGQPVQRDSSPRAIEPDPLPSKPPGAAQPVLSKNHSRCFREIIKTEHSSNAYGATLVDMDGDAILDVVAIDAPMESEAIRMWKGDTAGRFAPTTSVAYNGGGLDFAVLDFNRDGKPDLATSDRDAASVTLWIGTGDGNVTRGISQPTYRTPLGIGAADLDADGFSDLFVGHYFHVEVMRGSKDGKLRTSPWLKLVKEPDPSNLLTPENIVAADLTGDGLLELVIAKGDVTSIEVWTGRKRGGLVRTATATSCSTPAYTQVGDVIEDGHPDVVVRCGAAHWELFAGDGKGGLESRGSIGPEDAFGAGALIDLTGDGHLDLISPTTPGGLGMPGLPGFGTGTVLAVSAGDGKGGFSEVDTLKLDGFQHRVIAVVDIDGDGHLDVVQECHSQSPGAHLGVAFGTGCADDRVID